MADTETQVLVDIDGLAYYTAKQDLKNNNKFLKKADATTYTSMTATEATAGSQTEPRTISPKVLADFVNGKVSDVVGAAPAALDTLKELSDALGKDANFAATMTTQLGNKADKTTRKAGTAYALGDIAYLSALTNAKKLVCVKAGTTGSGSLTVSNTAEGAIITDGSVVWEIDSLADGIYDSAHQNGMYRGADLTAYWESGYMSANIQARKFVGMHIGDFITKSVTTAATTYTDKAGTSVTQAAATYSNVKWLLAGFDSHYLAGDSGSGINSHAVVVIPDKALQRNVSMNPTDDTTGGYLGSDMWRVHMPIWATAIKSAFGSGHVLAHRELLGNAINATAPSGAGTGWLGTTSSWAWTDVEVNIPNEQMIYGGRVFGSAEDGGDFPCHLPLFAHKQYVGGSDRSWYWLRAVASASCFARAHGDGIAGFHGASGSSASGGIRPYFLLR